jgi:hypothetical protein
MARLLPKDRRSKQKLSFSEAMGRAETKLKRKSVLGVVESADLLGIHKYTLREYIDKGLVSTVYIGSRHYLDEPELRRLQRLLADYGSLAKAFREAINQDQQPELPL